MDDINIIGVKSARTIQWVKTKLIAALEIIDIGLINFYLGLKIKANCEKRTLKLLQPVYIKKILVKYYFN